MPKLFSNTKIACSLALAASLCAAPAAFAAEPQQKPAKAVKAVKAKAKAPAKDRSHPKAEDVAMPDGPDADITDTTITEYSCELGNKVTIYHNDKDDTHIAVRWKKRIHRLDRIGTTTGARRFENPKFGLIWIGIPSKGMLLDSKLNRQLANECKNAEQAKPPVLEAAEPKKI